MRIFISWSGKRSQMLAQALRDWLPLVLYYLQPWLSETDIEAGKRWSVEIAKQLEESNFGIICLTPENIESSWILFEAGALAKSLQNGVVVPLLLNLDFREISGPLSQFQAKKVDRASIFEILQTINQGSEPPIETIRLSQLFEALWPQLEVQLKNIPSAPEGKGSTRTQKDILEELVTTVRGIDQRLRNLEESLPSAILPRIAVPPPPREIPPLDKKVEDKARDLLKQGNKLEAAATILESGGRTAKEVTELIEAWELEASGSQDSA